MEKIEGNQNSISNQHQQIIFIYREKKEKNAKMILLRNQNLSISFVSKTQTELFSI